MKKEDRAQFAKYMLGVLEVYGESATKERIEIYFNVLADYEFSLVKQAIDSHVKNPDNGQFFPKPADLIRALTGTTKNQALIACSKFVKAIIHVGNYQSIVFDDEKIHAVVEGLGGWQKVCGGKLKDQVFLENEFKDRYAHFVVHPPESYPPILIGAIDAQFSSPDPKNITLWGDKEKAKRVMCLQNEQKRIA
jgi:hypothetical protein